jgi:uncharacterized protein (DUF433 family)
MSIQTPERVDLRKYIELRLMRQRPHIRGRRIPVAIIVYQSRANGWTVTETAWNFSLSEAEVLAAMLYYEEHKTEIDQQEAEEARLIEAEKHGKP